MLLIQALAFFGFPSKVDGCPSFSSWGLGAAWVVVKAMVEVLGCWWLMRNGFLVLSKGLSGVQGSS